MNTQESDVLIALAAKPYQNQRDLAERCGHSLGIVNRSVRTLQAEGYLSDGFHLTQKAKEKFRENAPKNAVILAAGFGMRMVPINMEIPKAFLEVKGEPLIERLIKQLHEAGIHEIYIVVGFMKERFDYLIDQYGVTLIVNTKYGESNNLYSLNLALDKLSNTYVIPCDVRCDVNPFRSAELYSWYMVSDAEDSSSCVRVNRKTELVRRKEGDGGNRMVGISYLLEPQAKQIRDRISRMCESGRHTNAFWEESLFDGNKMIVSARVVPSSDAVELNTYEQLREIDSDSRQLQSKPIQIAAESLHVLPECISDITVLKKGMTNRSFLFTCNGEKYIMRIPGEGTDQLINRMEEAAVYQQIRDKNISDHVVYMSPQNGYKITKYIENTRVCDPFDPADVAKCMDVLRDFHGMHLSVDHEFDLFGMIEFYESLRGDCSCYCDYEQTKRNVFSLKALVDKMPKEKTLTHIDAVPDNFLIFTDPSGKEHIKLIDWEYAGMQDPHVDIAMFCIYALYDRAHVDALIHAYFQEKFTDALRRKVYCYIAICGLLWSNWCEYKRMLGVEFGEYALRQYRYAKDYYKIVREEIGEGDSLCIK